MIASMGGGNYSTAYLAIIGRMSGSDVELVLTHIFTSPVTVYSVAAATIKNPIPRVGVRYDEELKCVATPDTDLKS